MINNFIERLGLTEIENSDVLNLCQDFKWILRKYKMSCKTSVFAQFPNIYELGFNCPWIVLFVRKTMFSIGFQFQFQVVMLRVLNI